MNRMPRPRTSAWLATAATLMLVVAVLMRPAVTCAAAPPTPHKSASSQTEVDQNNWSSLAVVQRKALAPLAAQWDTMDSTSREKWLIVAERYPRLSPAAQERMRSRMTQWAQLPAQQRGEARLRFQNSRDMGTEERQAKWAAYQALPPEERKGLAQQARRKQKPVMLPDTEPGPREAMQQGQRSAAKNHADRKSNTVPTPSRTATRAITPTLVKAGSGATTSLISQTAMPPLHQHTGLNKINATKGFVDPQTLLPRKGSQSAAMTPVPASQAASAKVSQP
jgi:hypothetical protein